MKELAISVKNMVEEQKDQGDRIKRLEEEPADKLRLVKRTALTSGAGVVIGALTTSVFVRLRSRMPNIPKAGQAPGILLQMRKAAHTAPSISGGLQARRFTAAVKAYQSNYGCIVDGEITAQKKTWKSLLGMI